MSALEQVLEILPALTRSEKAQLLQWVAHDLGDAFPGIDATAEVMGGDACVLRTRIPVWLLVQAHQQGMSESDLLRSYPTLTAQDLANVWAFYRANRAEVDAQIVAHESA